MVQTQSLLTHMFGQSQPKRRGTVKFFDLFCGIGGASTGASDAGLDVVFAADFCPLALTSHAHNHPACKHKEMTFPCEDSELPFPEDDSIVHVHGSPPCTRLTPMQMQTDQKKKDEAVELVRWFLDLALRKSPQHWSMEQVGHPRVMAVLDAMRRSNRNVDYVVLDFADLSLPQHRRRLIAGPPWLVDNLRAFRSAQRRVPLGRAVTTMPPETKYVRNSLVNDSSADNMSRLPKRKSMRRVTRPAFTVVTTIALRWCDANKNCIRSMSIPELLTVQGYPSWYTFPSGIKKLVRLRGVGNSVPPLVMSLALGRRPPSAPPVREGERGACDSGPDTDGEDLDGEVQRAPDVGEFLDLAAGMRAGSPSLR